MTQKVFQAYGKKGSHSKTAATPRKAAAAFFETNPNRRACNIIEGTQDGPFFCVVYGMTSEGDWPQFFKDVTKKGVDTLPDGVQA